MSTKLVEKREEFDQKQGIVAQMLKQAGSDQDFSKVTVFGEDLTNGDKVKKFQELDKELGDLSTEIKGLEALEKAQGDIFNNAHERGRPADKQGHTHSGSNGRQPVSTKSIGDRIVESEEYGEFRKDHTKGFSVFFEDVSLKTLMSTTAGWAPTSDDTGRMVEAVTRPIQVLDLIPVADTDSNSVTYWEETLRTHSAAEKFEGVAYAESAFEWTEKVSQVRKITDSIPVTDEQLEDRSQVRSLLEQRLGFGVRQRLDSQVLNGDGVPPNLEGILNVAGIQTQAKGGDPVFDAIHKAMTKVRVTGRAVPGAVVLHPNDWQDVRLTRTADGIYILGNPAISGPMTLFGIPVVLGDVIAEGTGLVGDFANFSRIYDKRGLSIQVGYVGDQFKEGKQTIRADIRVAFTVERPAAFATITGI
jgi:HK97 family phage major capsid protein